MRFDADGVDPDSPLALRAAELARRIVAAKVDVASAGPLEGNWGEALLSVLEEAERDPGLAYLLAGALATFAGAAIELASEVAGVPPTTVLDVLAVKYEKEGLGL